MEEIGLILFRKVVIMNNVNSLWSVYYSVMAFMWSPDYASLDVFEFVDDDVVMLNK